MWSSPFLHGHTYRRVDGSLLPESADERDNTLVISSPVPADSGEYICFSRDANSTYSLVVENPPSSSPMTSPGPVDSGEH